MTELIYTKYSNERDRRFAIRTDILEENGTRVIRKEALYPEGRDHVQNLAEYETKLNQLYDGTFVCNRVLDQEENSIRLEYLEGETLEEQLDECITDHNLEEAEGILMDYLEKLRQIHEKELFSSTPEFQAVFGASEIPEGEMASPYMNIDMVCENLLRKEQDAVLDYEWTFAFPVPCRFLLYRVIFYYFHANKIRSVLKEEVFYQHFGITPELMAVFEKMEKNFQKYITGKHVPVREMYPSITPGVSVVKTIASSQLQLYFSKGEAYREEDSCYFPIYGEEIKAEYELPEQVNMIRIDPGENPCSLEIHEISFDGKAADLSQMVVHKGFMSKNWVHIARKDPAMENIPVPAGSRKVTIHLSVFPATEEQMEGIWRIGKENLRLRAQNEQQSHLIREMRNTKIWKLYQTYRNMVEKKKSN